jgi:hypothetical protein
LGRVHSANVDDAPYALLLEVRDCQDSKDIYDCIRASLLLVSEEVALESIVPGLDVVVCIDRGVGYVLTVAKHPTLLYLLDLPLVWLEHRLAKVVLVEIVHKILLVAPDLAEGLDKLLSHRIAPFIQDLAKIRSELKVGRRRLIVINCIYYM